MEKNQMLSQLDLLDCQIINRFSFPSRTNFKISSPNKVLAQANHERVKFFGSSLWKVSCINPVSASVATSVFRQLEISLSLLLVMASMIRLIGQTMSRPT